MSRAQRTNKFYNNVFIEYSKTIIDYFNKIDNGEEIYNEITWKYLSYKVENYIYDNFDLIYKNRDIIEGLSKFALVP